MFGPLSMDMYLPSLPTLADYFSTSASKAQLTLSGFTIGFAFCQLIYGPLADRYGRRWLLVGGIALYTVASYLCSTATEIDNLILYRFVQAVGGGAGVVLTRAIIRDLYSKEAGARALSLLLLAPSLAALIGPFIGGQILLWSEWNAIFWLLAILGALIFVLSIVKLPETLAPDMRQSLGAMKILREYGMILFDRRSLGFMLCGAFSFAGMFAQLSGTPFVYIQLFGVAPEHFGFLFALNILGIMAGSYVNSRLVMRFGIRRMLIAGTTLALIGGFLVAGFATFGIGGLYGIVLPIVIFMMPHNIVNANATAGALEAYPHIAGTASALIGATRFATGALVGALVGILHDGTALPMAYVIAGCGLFSAAAFWFMTHEKNDKI
ncbi:MAG: Bcr/CflA family multidrug efflux MFS transporter [Rhodospirillaceae bacterium]|jgi:MFS transporter, DHA1 family, multidrug resistance protein|nr:Bcr/CflA family multidrug efflux MFS transporter [Rhodospirillaceae bacterium]